jgi:putative OPT family oligopeptide transporter
MSKNFQPFVPAESTAPEMTMKAVLAGVAMSALFGATNAYLAMKAGQTIAATIPAAVIALALFRLPFFRGGVLEQNITRTSASVGEALVAGVAFTVPAFFFAQVGGQRIWTDFRSHYWEGTILMLAGGLLGVMFIIILRRPLCVDSDLPFPEATACAEIVKAGQHASTEAPRLIFGAMGLGALLKFFTDSLGFRMFRETIGGFWEFPQAVIRHAGGAVSHAGGIPYTTPSALPALMGVGYIIGTRLSVINFSGSVLAWFGLIPAFLFLDPDLPQRLGVPAGAAVPWADLSTSVWLKVVRPIAVGTMLVAAVNTLYSMRDSLAASFRGAMESTGKAGAAAGANRLDRDIPLPWIILSTIGLVIPMGFIYYHFTQNLMTAVIAAVVMAAVGFFLAAIGGYLVGLMGSSNQPVSGLTLAALVIAALMMVALGVRGVAGVAAVLGVAAVACIACSVAGSLIQDLKAGHLLGGTPWKMQVAEIITVAVLAFFLMVPMILLHATYGIGGRDLPAPQANLMALLAQGIVGGEMAWGLVLIGAFFGVFLIMIGAPAPMLIAVGMYLPLETTGAICLGGIFKWLADRAAARRKLNAAETENVEQRGTMLASGFIAGEAIAAILLSLASIAASELYGFRKDPATGQGLDFSFTAWWSGQETLWLYTNYGNWLSLVVFAAVGYCLVRLPLAAKRA